MTRKDYRLLAQALYNAGATYSVIHSVADALAKEHQNFDRVRFVAMALNCTEPAQ